MYIAYAACISELLLAEGAKKVAVPYDFPIFYSNYFEKSGFSIVPGEKPFQENKEPEKTGRNRIL